MKPSRVISTLSSATHHYSKINGWGSKYGESIKEFEITTPNMDDNNVTPAAPITVFGASISILLVAIGFQVRFRIFRSPDKRSMEFADKGKWKITEYQHMNTLFLF